MDRLKFYTQVTVNDINELDYMSSVPIRNFKPKYELNTYRVVEEDLMAPDLISTKIFDTESYWWIIMRFNGIICPLTEMEVGDILYISNVLDIYDWYKASRKR